MYLVAYENCLTKFLQRTSFSEFNMPHVILILSQQILLYIVELWQCLQALDVSYWDTLTIAYLESHRKWDHDI